MQRSLSPYITHYDVLFQHKCHVSLVHSSILLVRLDLILAVDHETPHDISETARHTGSEQRHDACPCPVGVGTACRQTGYAVFVLGEETFG